MRDTKKILSQNNNSTKHNIMKKVLPSIRYFKCFWKEVKLLLKLSKLKLCIHFKHIIKLKIVMRFNITSRNKE